jgi:hypothetical protein
MITGSIQSKAFITGIIVIISRIFCQAVFASSDNVTGWFFGPPVRSVNGPEILA